MTPGRGIALTLGVPVLLVLIAWAAVNFVALVGQGNLPVHGRIPVRDGQLTARVDNGNVTLRQAVPGAGQGGAAELTGTAHYSLFRQTVTISGSAVHYPCHVPFGDCSLTATIEVPARTPVSLFTYGGDVAIPGFTGSGLMINTDGGDLTAGDLSGHLDLATGGGDLTARSLAGLVQVNSDGGDVTVGGISSATASIRSDGGDVEVIYDQVPGSLQINSGGGDVTLVLPRAQYNVYTNADGGALTTHGVVDDPSSGRSITVDSGGGDITITEAS
jgi:Putative adhesin